MKDSRVHLYANHNSEVSLWENPWHIVNEIDSSGAQAIEGSSSTSANSTLRHNLTVESEEVAHERETISSLWINDTPQTEQLYDGSTESPRAIEDVTKGGNDDDDDSRDLCFLGRPHSGERTVMVHGGNQASGSCVDVFSAQSTWIPRLCQERAQRIRIFQCELQNIMHAFGEVRFCSVEVLEFMEDAVRHIIQRVALGLSSRSNSDKLTVYDVSTCIRHDPRASLRLLLCLHRTRQTAHDLHVSIPTCREWDYLRHRATIQGFTMGDYPSYKHFQELPSVKNHNSCCERAKKVFWRGLGMLFKLQHEQCLHSCLTDRYSRCPTVITGMPRLDLFREWLALPEYIQVSDGTLHALGSLAREATAIMTQTALIQTCNNMQYCSYGQMLIDEIGPGICAGVVVPLSSIQTRELYAILHNMDFALTQNRNWSFRGDTPKVALQLKNVREAWRKLNEPNTLAAHRPFWVGF